MGPPEVAGSAAVACQHKRSGEPIEVRSRFFRLHMAGKSGHGATTSWPASVEAAVHEYVSHITHTHLRARAREAGKFVGVMSPLGPSTPPDLMRMSTHLYP